MDKMSYIGIRITLKEFESLSNGELKIIIRPRTKYWMYMLLEPLLIDNELSWKPKNEKYIVTYTNIKRTKFNQKFSIDNIIDDGDNIIININEKISSAQLSEVRIFGEKYESLNDILNTNKETQITNLLKSIPIN